MKRVILRDFLRRCFLIFPFGARTGSVRVFPLRSEPTISPLGEADQVLTASAAAGSSEGEGHDVLYEDGNNDIVNRGTVAAGRGRGI